MTQGPTVRVLLFASYADALGGAELSLTLPPGARVKDVRDVIRGMVQGKRVPERPLVAVNQRYVRDDHPVAPTDEVAIIPPVAGG